MSFSVDLWNGFEIIKGQIKSVLNKIKTFHKFLSSYKILETEYSYRLDSMIREVKENMKSEYIIDDAYKKVIEIFEHEKDERNNFINNLNKLSNEQDIANYLEQMKSKMNSYINNNIENYSVYDRSFKTVVDRQINFHKAIRELSVSLAQVELDEIYKTNKAKKNNVANMMEKVRMAKEEYVFYINEFNKERELYNFKGENLLEYLETLYKDILEKLKTDMLGLSNIRRGLFQELICKEANTYENVLSLIEPEKDTFNFIQNNATKEFPMIKVEICPIKLSTVISYIKQKIKIKDEAVAKVSKRINDYFINNNIFEEESFDNNSNNKMKKNVKGKKDDKNDNNQYLFAEKNKEFLENFADSLFKEINPKQMSEQKRANDVKDLFVGSQECLKLLNHNEGNFAYLETLLKRLTYARSRGTLEMKHEGQGILLSIFDNILQNNPKNDYVLKNVIVLCQTFYKVENNMKIYLVEGLKNRKIFTYPETWHRAINYSLNFSTRDKDLTSNKKNDVKERINKEAQAVILAYLWDIMQFTDDENVRNLIKDFYVKVYELNENFVNDRIKEYIYTIRQSNDNRQMKIPEQNNVKIIPKPKEPPKVVVNYAPKINIQPPKVNIQPPRVNIQPPKVNIQPPKVNIQPPKVNIQPPKVNIQPPKVNIQPPKVNIQPPKVNIQPPKVNIGKNSDKKLINIDENPKQEVQFNGKSNIIDKLKIFNKGASQKPTNNNNNQGYKVNININNNNQNKVLNFSEPPKKMNWIKIPKENKLNDYNVDYNYNYNNYKPPVLKINNDNEENYSQKNENDDYEKENNEENQNQNYKNEEEPKYNENSYGQNNEEQFRANDDYNQNNNNENYEQNDNKDYNQNYNEYENQNQNYNNEEQNYNNNEPKNNINDNYNNEENNYENQNNNNEDYKINQNDDVQNYENNLYNDNFNKMNEFDNIGNNQDYNEKDNNIYDDNIIQNDDQTSIVTKNKYTSSKSKLYGWNNYKKK